MGVSSIWIVQIILFQSQPYLFDFIAGLPALVAVRHRTVQSLLVEDFANDTVQVLVGAVHAERGAQSRLFLLPLVHAVAAPGVLAFGTLDRILQHHHANLALKELDFLVGLLVFWIGLVVDDQLCHAVLFKM